MTPQRTILPLLVVLLAAPATQACEVGNAITNCDFESDTAGWSTLIGDALSHTNATAHSGIGSAEIEPALNADAFELYIFTCIAVPADTSFGVRGYFQHAAGPTPPGCFFRMLYFSGSGCTGTILPGQSLPATTLSFISNGWTRVAGVVQTHTSAASATLSAHCRGPADYITRFDDVHAGPAALFGDGFESGNASGWSAAVGD